MRQIRVLNDRSAASTGCPPEGEDTMEVQAGSSGANTHGLKGVNTVVFVGHARLPQSLAPRDGSSVISVEIEADAGSGTIVGAGVKAVPELGSRLVADILTGRNMDDGPEGPVNEISHRYICPSQKALTTAILKAFEAHSRSAQANVTSGTGIMPVARTKVGRVVDSSSEGEAAERLSDEFKALHPNIPWRQTA